MMLQYQRINRWMCSKFRPWSWPSIVCRTFQTNSDQTNSTEFEFAKLSNKCIISLSGPETLGFLQGIVTNDVRHLTEDQSTSVQHSCIYSFMLNNTGRILADLFLYKFHQNDNLILLEVDKRIKDSIIKLLKRYRVKKQISITTDDAFNIYVCFSNQYDNLPNQRLELNDSKSRTIWTLDPRNYRFGFKILTTTTSMNSDYFAKLLAQNSKCANLITVKNIRESDHDSYRSFRYRYGIAEGVDDLTPEICFPLEANGDILNGISFHKGCYVGQELTARTFHTGVIRKRIMPIKILKDLNKTDMLPSQNVIDDQGKQLGRFCCNFAGSGLASLKFNNIPSDVGKQKIKLSISQHPIHAWRPFWWPNSLM